MKKGILILLLFIGFKATAQLNLDSLNQVWLDETQEDTVRFQALYRITWDHYLFNKPDTAFILAQQLLNLAQQKGNRKWEGIANNLQGGAYSTRGNKSAELTHHQSALKIFEEIGYKKGIAGTLYNIGIIYFSQEKLKEALDFYQRSLKIQEEIGNNKGISSCLSNIGAIYVEQGDYKTALTYCKRGLKIDEEIGDKSGRAYSLLIIGNIYVKQEYLNEALVNLLNSRKLFEEIGNKWGLAATLNQIGIVYTKQGKIPEALEHLKKSMPIAQEVGAPKIIQGAARALKNLYKVQNEGIKALEMYELEIQMRDSLQSEEAKKGLIQMEVEHEYEKKELIAEQEHQKEIYEKNKTRNYLAGGGLLALILAGGVLTRLRYVRKAKSIVEKEKDRSNNLLLNILPADIAEELKVHGKAEARDFALTSIIFTDFKGFTKASTTLSAQELVGEINTCFEAFDHICEKYSIEKIKTIGDAYMAAGGLPVPSDDSIKNTILAALEMQAFMVKQHQEKEANGEQAFEMRAGVHTGPVVAGIVGVKKFQYDIWGDTVNTASRMESHGQVGKVNISQATYELLKNDSDFAFESRGKIEVKGKGLMEMYYISRS